MKKKQDAILQMYGEKAEEAEELKLDIQDLKLMYRQQVNLVIETTNMLASLHGYPCVEEKSQVVINEILHLLALLRSTCDYSLPHQLNSFALRLQSYEIWPHVAYISCSLCCDHWLDVAVDVRHSLLLLECSLSLFALLL